MECTECTDGRAFFDIHIVVWVAAHAMMMIFDLTDSIGCRGVQVVVMVMIMVMVIMVMMIVVIMIMVMMIMVIMIVVMMIVVMMIVVMMIVVMMIVVVQVSSLLSAVRRRQPYYVETSSARTRSITGLPSSADHRRRICKRGLCE